MFSFSYAGSVRAILALALSLSMAAPAPAQAANDKFTERFTALEADLEAQGRSVHQASLEEMEAAWQRAKAGGRSSSGS